MPKFLLKYQTKLILMVTVVLLASNFISAQITPTDENQTLQQQILRFYQQGNFDEAIPLAEKVLKLEKKKSTKTPQSIATANYNIALLRKKRLIINKDKVANWKNSDKKQLRNTYATIEEDAKESEKHFREVIKIYKEDIAKPTQNESLQLASAQNELAWILHKHRLYSRYISSTRKRLKDAEEFYNAALSIKKEILGDDSDQTISTTFDLAKFYKEQTNFEKALALYQSVVTLNTNKNGEINSAALPALYPIAKIFVTINEIKKAEDIVNSIAVITKDNATLPLANYVLNKRLTEKASNLIYRNPRLEENIKRAILTSILMKGAFTRHSGGVIGTNDIPIKVVVDENGDVIEASSDYEDKNLRRKAIAKVKKWKFRPFELDGKKSKMKGYVVYMRTILR